MERPAGMKCDDCGKLQGGYLFTWPQEEPQDLSSLTFKLATTVRDSDALVWCGIL
jgi:hypothetical protein